MASRAFSTTSPTYAADVKSLGVIGSGQMVSWFNWDMGHIAAVLR